jgi:hypothetical protein
MDILKSYQNKFLCILNELYIIENNDNEKLHLIEDCLLMLTELNQMLIDANTDECEISKKDLVNVVSDAIDIERFYNKYKNIKI